MSAWANIVRALLGIAAVAGCTHTATYGYQYRLDHAFGGTEEPEQPPVEARQLLANAKTVAFYPPEICVNTEKQTDRASSVFARCGALLSKLERDAERAGYEVVSWVNLRGASRPIEYAREAKVDVLFEINELLPRPIDDVDAQRKLTFFDRPEDAPDQELQVSGTVADRCHQWSLQHDKQVPAGLTSTLDIKTVSVADGRARWHYRKTVSEASGQEYPKVRFVGVQQPNKAGNVLFGIGAATLISAIIFAVVDASVTSGTDLMGRPKQKVFGDYPYYLMVPGALLTAGGIVLMVTTSQSKPDPDTVLCLEEHIPKNGLVDSTSTGRSGAYTFDESHESDPLKKQEEKLGQDRANEFFAILTQIHTVPVRPALAPASATTPAPTTAPNHP